MSADAEVSNRLEDLTVSDDAEDDVNPWSVTSSSDKGVDYDKLVSTKMFLISMYLKPQSTHFKMIFHFQSVLAAQKSTVYFLIAWFVSQESPSITCLRGEYSSLTGTSMLY